MRKLSLLLLFNLFYFVVNAQNTYTVDNKPGAPADYNNLQNAIDSVPAGSTLLVQGSPYTYENITLNKQLKLIGTGYFLDQNPNTQAYTEEARINQIIVQAGANGSEISGVTTNNAISLNNCSNILVSHCQTNINIVDSHYITILNNYSYHTALHGNVSNIIFKGNFIYLQVDFNNGANSTALTLIGNYMQYISDTAEAYNNIFISSGPCNSAQVHHNVFTGSPSPSGPDPCPPNNNYNTYSNNSSVIFISSSNPAYSSDGRFLLKSGSPAAGAGVGGVDCGPIGAGYRLSGIPNIPNIYEFTVPDTGYTNDGGIPVTIKVKSNN